MQPYKSEDHRPWGYYEVLRGGADFKVKRVVIYPGKRLSLQRHFHRREHWYVLCGEAVITLGDRQFSVKGGGSIDIPEKALHRVLNPGTEDLIFIEVQNGEFCLEEDIERLEDDYGRV
jgi:mannose-6-phosphate isomerase